MEKDAKIVQGWVDQVNDEGRNLTSWELGFMESITDQFTKTKSLSDRQLEILERIYAEKTP